MHQKTLSRSPVHSSNKVLHGAASAVGSAVKSATWPGTGCMSGPEKRGKVPSRQWSCSDMVNGHKELVKAKKEHDSDEELEAQIKDCFPQIVNGSIINMIWRVTHSYEPMTFDTYPILFSSQTSRTMKRSLLCWRRQWFPSSYGLCVLSWNILNLLVLVMCSKKRNRDLPSLIFCTLIMDIQVETRCLNLPEAESDTQPVPDLQLIFLNVCCPPIQRS